VPTELIARTSIAVTDVPGAIAALAGLPVPPPIVKLVAVLSTKIVLGVPASVYRTSYCVIAEPPLLGAVQESGTVEEVTVPVAKSVIALGV